MKKKIIMFLVALSVMVMLSACENPNASKTDKVGSYASAPAYIERIG